LTDFYVYVGNIKLDRYLVLHFWIFCLNKKRTLLAGPNKLNKNQLKNVCQTIFVELKHENYVCPFLCNDLFLTNLIKYDYCIMDVVQRHVLLFCSEKLLFVYTVCTYSLFALYTHTHTYITQ